MKNTILLTDEQAKQFIIFQKRYALFGLLESIGAFDIRGGSVEVHFSKLGEISGIDKHEHYRVPLSPLVHSL